MVRANSVARVGRRAGRRCPPALVEVATVGWRIAREQPPTREAWLHSDPEHEHAFRFEDGERGNDAVEVVDVL